MRWVGSLCLGGLLVWGGSMAWADALRISGTGAAITAIQKVTDTYRQQHPETLFRFYLPPMGSSGAIKALAARQLDIALVGRPLKPAETAGLVQKWLGRSPFLFVVHKASPVTQLTLAQLTAIYAGRQQTWPDGSRIRVVLRPVADADTALLKSISPAMNEAVTMAHAHRPPGSALADTDIELADMVEKVPGGLGSVALALIVAENRSLKGLVMDGVEPTVAALEEGRYPYAKPFFVITRHDAPDAVRAVVDYLLSPEGKSLLRSFGISPMGP